MFIPPGNLLPKFVARLLQACCLFYYTWAVIGWPFFSMALFPYMLFSRYFWPVALLYAAWMAYDWNTPKRGSRPWKLYRGLFAWKVVADYFPIKTIKTAELPTDRNYIFAAHPHGVLGTSSALMFCTTVTEFPKLFPGIFVNAVTIPVNFWFPLRREFLMGLGVITSDAESIGHVLSRSPCGNAVGIVCGGVAEMIKTKPDAHKLVLAKRKGFVKLALKYGADLVPVYHFGEERVFINFPNKKGSLLRKYQNFVKSLTLLRNSSFPAAYGRSFLSVVLPEKWMVKLPKIMRYGMLPFRQKIVSIVGAPIRVEKCEHPSQQQIDALHADYCTRLRALFEQYKCELGGLPESARLEFI